MARGGLLFGSEIKALRAHPAWRGEIAREVVPIYLRHGYIPAPHTIWRGLFKLPPGTTLTLHDLVPDFLPDPVPYWSLSAVVAGASHNRFEGTATEATELLETQLRRSVADQMVADVPLGAFLSGGVDSSVVVALMQAQSRRPVRTFSIGFDEAGYDEAVFARAVAKHLGTDHTEMYVTSDQARSVIPSLVGIYDEPFGDSSAIPTLLVSALARKSVTVSLSGDGGDELFGGYGRYLVSERIWNRLRSLPAPFRPILGRLARGPAVSWFDALAQVLSGACGRGAWRSLASRAELLASMSACTSVSTHYLTMTSQWSTPPVAPPAPAGAVADSSLAFAHAITEPVEVMMAIDSLMYLPDDVLAKVDRAAMSVGLETRVPLLDHRVVETAWRMPFKWKVHSGRGKWLLRQVLYRHVPRELVDRPKMGFGVPVDRWIRGPLRDWAEDLLSERSLGAHGLLDPVPIRKRWSQHLRRQQDGRDPLWIVLMLQGWLREQAA